METWDLAFLNEIQTRKANYLLAVFHHFTCVISSFQSTQIKVLLIILNLGIIMLFFGAWSSHDFLYSRSTTVPGRIQWFFAFRVPVPGSTRKALYSCSTFPWTIEIWKRTRKKKFIRIYFDFQFWKKFYKFNKHF